MMMMTLGRRGSAEAGSAIERKKVTDQIIADGRSQNTCLPPLQWRFSAVAAESLQVGPRGGFVATSPSARASLGVFKGKLQLSRSLVAEVDDEA
jgi:hypothetical protein